MPGSITNLNIDNKREQLSAEALEKFYNTQRTLTRRDVGRVESFIDNAFGNSVISRYWDGEKWLIVT
jgi:hypothetical protein